MQTGDLLSAVPSTTTKTSTRPYHNNQQSMTIPSWWSQTWKQYCGKKYARKGNAISSARCAVQRPKNGRHCNQQQQRRRHWCNANDSHFAGPSQHALSKRKLIAKRKLIDPWLCGCLLLGNTGTKTAPAKLGPIGNLHFDLTIRSCTQTLSNPKQSFEPWRPTASNSPSSRTI